MGVRATPQLVGRYIECPGGSEPHHTTATVHKQQKYNYIFASPYLHRDDNMRVQVDQTPLLELESGSSSSGPVSSMDTIPDPPESGLSTAEANRLLEIHGYNELASKEATPIWDFLKNFWGPMPIMIWIAIIVELIPKPEADYSTRPSWADFAVLLTLQIVNGLVGWYEHQKAGDAVAALKNSLSPKANVKRNGQWLSIPGRELVPGDLVSLVSFLPRTSCCCNKIPKYDVVYY